MSVSVSTFFVVSCLILCPFFQDPLFRVRFSVSTSFQVRFLCPFHRVHCSSHLVTALVSSHRRARLVLSPCLSHHHTRLIAMLVFYFSVHPWVHICICLSDRLRSCVPLSPGPFPCQVFYLNFCSCSAAQQLGTVSPLYSPTFLVAMLQS